MDAIHYVAIHYVLLHCRVKLMRVIHYVVNHVISQSTEFQLNQLNCPAKNYVVNNSVVFHSLPTQTIDVPGAGKRRYHRCTLVQDGHTAGEDRLFNTMVRLVKRKGRFLADGSWLLSVSMDDLAEAAVMHRTNVRNNLKGLITKLAIEQTRERNMHRLAPRTYHGFTFRQILERRRTAGMEWVVRSRGVVFVPIAEVEKALRSDSLRSDSTPEAESLPSEPLPSVGSESHQTLRSESRPSILLGRNALGKTSSSEASPLVCNAIMNVLGMIDDDAVALLIRKCRQSATDASDEEIAELAAFQCRRILRMRNVDNPVGMLIQQLPKCFEGESFARYRREKAEEAKRIEELYDQT